MVIGVRGPGGGYKLSRNAADINIEEIITAVDEPVGATKCEGRGDCQDSLPCLTHDLWLGLSEQIRSYLQGISLGGLLEKDHVTMIAKRQDRKAESIETIIIQEKKSA
jgi:Rrf2 family iron-sulfur cluster assembly transcriptional regulator